jgi:hypothetical protein
MWRHVNSSPQQKNVLHAARCYAKRAARKSVRRVKMAPLHIAWLSALSPYRLARVPHTRRNAVHRYEDSVHERTALVH